MKITILILLFIYNLFGNNDNTNISQMNCEYPKSIEDIDTESISLEEQRKNLSNYLSFVISM